MNKLYLFCGFLLNELLLLPGCLLAQENYVANSVNSPTPGALNTLVGPGAGGGGSLTGDRNAVTGYNAGRVLTSGSKNSFFGVDAGRFTTKGSENVFIGFESGLSNTEGYYNTFVGRAAGYSNTTGTYNVFLGNAAGYGTTTGYQNIFIGHNTGQANTTGSDNVFIGNGAGFTHRTGYSNTFIGSLTGFYNTTGSENTFLGGGTALINSTGSQNTMIGSGAGSSNSTGAQNTFVGYQAGYNNTTGTNTFLGYQSGYYTTSGTANVFLGSQAGFNNTTGKGNLFMGNQAGSNNTTASYNLFMGNSSGSATTTGLGNTAIGDGAFLNSSTGANNVSIGRYAGINMTTGSNNTFIGVAATAPSGSGALTNATAIGYNASVTASNALILGSGVNVGIGNTAPNNKLEITQGTSGNSGLRFTNLTSGSPATALNQTRFLSVNASGDVILASSNNTARLGAELWAATGEHVQSTNQGGVIIGQGIAKNPVGYKLYVEQGILTEKVKVAVKNTDAWSDKVFASAYTLLPLAEVEQYIQQHQHLPGIPSAKEMVERGNDLHQTDATLLEKIEELTLYSIELEKARKQQQKEIDELRQLVKQLAQKK